MRVSRIPSAYLPLNGVRSDGEQRRVSRSVGFLVLASSTTQEDVSMMRDVWGEILMSSLGFSKNRI